MEYNFDRPIDRTREISIKWSPKLRRQMFGADDVIPMGIADMDFETAPAVAQAIRRRAEHGTYGYAYPPRTIFRPAWTGRSAATAGTSGPTGSSIPPG